MSIITRLTELAASMQANTAAILKALGRKRAVVSVTMDIAANASEDYSLPTLLGASFADYDVMATEVTVLVKDTLTGSATKDYFINSEASIAVGITEAGAVRLTNLMSTVSNVHIRIVAVRKSA